MRLFYRYNPAWLMILLLSLSSGVAAQDVRFSARAIGHNTFEAFMDARNVPKIYALSPPELLISCRAADGTQREIWVEFHNTAIEAGRLVSKVLPLPKDCSTWSGLLAATTDFGLGSADGPAPTIRVSQGVINGTAQDLSGPLAAPVLHAPPDGSILNHYPRTTYLVWYPVPGAVSYSVEVQIGFQGQWHVWKVYPNIRTNHFQFDFVGAQPGQWRVWAISKSDQPGYPSRWWQFQYTR